MIYNPLDSKRGFFVPVGETWDGANGRVDMADNVESEKISVTFYIPDHWSRGFIVSALVVPAADGNARVKITGAGCSPDGTLAARSKNGSYANVAVVTTDANMVADLTVDTALPGDLWYCSLFRDAQVDSGDTVVGELYLYGFLVKEL